jgi:pimeloyl-ACP methyl ester carboxylesterase
VNNPQLLTQFGGPDVNLNNGRYTRYYLSDQADRQPDAILVLVPGFEGGASNFLVLADQLMHRARAENSLTLEVWAVDRRSNQLEDTVGLDLAEDLQDINVGLNFLFGDDLGLELSQPLVDGPNRRAIFYNNNTDTAFMAQWTPLVHSRDIDAIVEQARARALNANVFLGGHSAGTGYTARYAATDFNFAGGEPEPGFRKLRGLILLEGGGASDSGAIPDAETLDLIEARFDGGLYGAVRDGAPRCIDGETACTVETQANDCAAFSNQQCVVNTPAYSDAGGLISPQLLAVSEVNALDVLINGDGVQSILQLEQNGEPGNTAINKVPQLGALNALFGDAPSSSLSLLGQFLDDDGVVASVASFVATSVGFPGPEVDGVKTWLTGDEEIPAEAFVDNGPAPQELNLVRRWGVEAEPSDLDGSMLPMFYRGATNFSDWYYPSSGLSVVSGLGLDTTALSAPPPAGRGRSDIANRTQGALIDIPVIALGGSNGLTPTPASWLGFARAIAPCAAPACDGTTPRLVDENNPNPVFPTFGDVSGGFEVYISEGYAHLDVLTAEDDESNKVIAPLLDFVARHLQ